MYSLNTYQTLEFNVCLSIEHLILQKKIAKDTYFLIEIHFQDQGYQLEENWLINEGSVYYSFNKYLDPMVG